MQPDTDAASRHPEPRGTLAPKLLALVGSVCVALAAAVVWLLVERSRPFDSSQVQQLLANPAFREYVVRNLVTKFDAVWDTHNDPDVGRVLQPRISEKEFRGVALSSNTYGMREAEYALPKPPGVMRVVLLGDSYVFGYGASPEDRVGVFLKKYLTEHGNPAQQIEVLHIAASSWNVVSECAYVRRQLGLLQPDVVLHITTDNDLDDTQGVRGFGAMARFSPQQRGRGDCITLESFGITFLGLAEHNYLADGLDHESRSRFASARAEVTRLAAALTRRGARYCMIANWKQHNPVVDNRLADGLEPAQRAYVATPWAMDRNNWVSESDGHWNRTGAEQMARAMFHLLQERGLCPELKLRAWPEAEAAAAAVFTELPDAAQRQRALARRAARITDKLDFARIDDALGRQVNTGIGADRLVSSHLSLTLRSHPRGTLRIEGSNLDRDEIAGARVTVEVDGMAVGQFEIVPGEPIDESWSLPAALDDREIVTVALSCDDWVYADMVTQQLAAFRLDRVGIVP